jgi:hypothetical protein
MFNIVLISGSNNPASIRTPKNRIANNNKAAEGATTFNPSYIISPSLELNPPIMAKTIGTIVRAVTGDKRLDIIK